eukprot:6184549-Pleurochrysis_carterae.AAC.5
MRGRRCSGGSSSGRGRELLSTTRFTVIHGATRCGSVGVCSSSAVAAGSAVPAAQWRSVAARGRVISGTRARIYLR